MDPLGKFLSGLLGYALGTHQIRQREAIKRLSDERVVRLSNHVYAKAYAFLSRAKIGGKGQQLKLSDIVGEVALTQFCLEVAELVRKELESQP